MRISTIPTARSAGLALLFVFFGLLSAPVNAGGSEEAELGNLLNAERTKRGMAPLSPDAGLLAVARNHSALMARRGRIFHNSQLTSQVTGWTSIGENVGRGANAQVVHQSFMASGTHRAQILSSAYNKFAVGTATSGGNIWVTEVFARMGSGEVRASKAPRAAPKIVAPAQVAKTPVTTPTAPPPVPASPLVLEELPPFEESLMLARERQRTRPAMAAAWRHSVWQTLLF